MTSREFCYWLQGFFEIYRGGRHAPSLDLAQVECIEKHLALVFKHEIDPSQGPPEHQAELNAIHGGMAQELEALKKRLEEVEKRPPQKVVHSNSDGPFGPKMRC